MKRINFSTFLAVLAALALCGLNTARALDFHVATAEAAAAFFTHKSFILPIPPRRYPTRARAASRRPDCGTGDIR